MPGRPSVTGQLVQNVADLLGGHRPHLDQDRAEALSLAAAAL
jgi:hypothetical protein